MIVTVLLNNFNYGRYVGAAIESVLSQSYQDFELIIVDDGSTDDSREVISAYRDPRIVTVFKANGGQASAFNVGFAKASGEYIAFLDSDDLWDPNKLERCVTVLRAEPDVALLNHAYQTIDAQGNSIGKPSKFSHLGRYNLIDDLRQSKVELPLVPTSFFVGRRRECLQLVLDEVTWKIAADTPVIFGLGLRGPIFNLNETLGSYRRHGVNKFDAQLSGEFLFKHYQRVYEFVNAECKRMGIVEEFKFLDSVFATNYQLCRTSWHSPLGLWLRMKRFLQKSK